ncbi:hypothetical protein V6N12_062486 [Hibiscus sabdariffa]|uniref:Uncharacterized protein n=1 Tax=Hibiscus sabdariffa TaxID=183260 RepID=A0ABR2F904_9ROSI
MKGGGALETDEHAFVGHFLALKRKSAGVKAWLATLPFGPNVSSRFPSGNSSSSSYNSDRHCISEPEMPGGFKSWRRLGMKAIFLRDALKVSLVPVMWSTEIGGHLSCPYYVVEASAVLFLEPSEGDVCVPSNFRGVCYVKVIRLTMEVVSAMGQLRKERRVGKKRLGLNERDKVDKSLGKERSARLETKKLLEEFNDYTNKCERNIMYIVQMVEGPLDLSDVELDCCWSVV